MSTGERVIGIERVAGYVPRYRLDGAVVSKTWGTRLRGARAVANHDEDSITMAVEAALYALDGLDPSTVDGLYFASVSAPYEEKQNAATIAAACDLRRDIFSADFGGSLRAGSAALRAARDAVEGGSARRVLVAIADARRVEPGTPEEITQGDGAAVFVVASAAPAARIVSISSSCEDFLETWKRPEDPYLRFGDPKFSTDYGIIRQCEEAIEQWLERTGHERQSIDRVILPGADVRTQRQLARRLGFDASKYPKEPLVARIGHAGAAAPFLSLIEGLEKAGPKESVLLLVQGNGCDVVHLRTSEAVRGLRVVPSIEEQVGRTRELESYGRYLKFRRFLPEDRLRPFSSPAVLWRDEEENIRLYGGSCSGCGAIQYPPRRSCWRCGLRGRFEKVRLGRRGRVFTFARDHLVPTPDPPVVMVSVDLEGGGRFYAQMTDCAPEEVEIGMEVRLTFRRLHEGENFVNYFWKFRPA